MGKWSRGNEEKRKSALSGKVQKELTDTEANFTVDPPSPIQIQSAILTFIKKREISRFFFKNLIKVLLEMATPN